MVYFSYDDYLQPMESRGMPMKTMRGAPVPYYMAFPMEDGLEAEEQNQRDSEYMKQMYPEKIQRIMAVIDEECDKLEYEGSMMFDEHPDRVMLSKLCADIYARVRDVEAEEIYEAMQRRPGRPPEADWDDRRGRNDRLSDIIQILLFDEMHRRRCRFRNGRCRRWGSFGRTY